MEVMLIRSSRTMTRTWLVLTAITLLDTEICIADRPCYAFSARSYVELGSSFQVFCTFIAPGHKCEKHMCMQQEKQSFGIYNSSTIYLNVTKIEKNRTFTCSCNNCQDTPNPCGLDVFTGYPPGIPQNLSCFQKGELAPVTCSWSRERETHLGTISKLWVKMLSNKSTDGPRSYTASGSKWLMAQFEVHGSAPSAFSVWVEATNKLDSINSTAVNFTLSDIAMPLPPEVTQARCSSRHCDLEVKVANRTQLLEFQYLTEQKPWMAGPHIHSRTRTEMSQSIQFLEPYKLYNFRARTKFSTGWWSEWSRNIYNWTEEEVPAKALEVWQTKTSTKSNLSLHWKELNSSQARGKILQYEVVVHNPRAGTTSSTNTSARHHTVALCAECEAKVYAWNSRGRSPPHSVTFFRRDQPAPRSVSCQVVNHHSVAISWQKPAEQVLGYVVEWYPAGRQDTHLSWHTLGPTERSTVITDNFKPYECFEGAVSALYKGAVGRTPFWTATQELVPTQGPVSHAEVEGHKVTVIWKAVPQEHLMGCAIGYTIHMKHRGKYHVYNCSSLERTFSTELTPSAEEVYIVWVTVRTAKGESPAGNTQSVLINPQNDQSILLAAWIVLVLYGVIILYMICLCQNTTLRHRFLDIVPDPANSKWAKECVNDKGKLSLKFYPGHSSWREAEPVMADVQEFTEESWMSGSVAPTAVPGDVSHLPLLQPSPSPMTCPATTLSPQSSYLKSFSLESESSERTQDSQDTDTTVDYISTYGSGQVMEEVEDAENDFFNGTGFPPSLFMSSLTPSDTKLTLDSVLIDCSDFEIG